MNDRTFSSPVFVNSSTHLIHEIVTLEDALDFLEEWPLARRGPIYETALKSLPACLHARCASRRRTRGACRLCEVGWHL